jgi:uncharacterized protein YodC (DUF2158 family)
MDQEFTIGDVVQLKSGGPKMTIEHIGNYAYTGREIKAKCVWFEGTKQKNGVFALETLIKI